MTGTTTADAAGPAAADAGVEHVERVDGGELAGSRVTRAKAAGGALPHPGTRLPAHPCRLAAVTGHRLRSQGGHLGLLRTEATTW
ncbi:hypothetical protein ACFY30_37110 [Streptomyces sp. NPDC000345]|uniref:hypothetical protein n=1 Tax=Streptomyces sp. NPDC000345 TaxID=3364537 RepID=UPI0036BDD4C0